MKIAVFFHDGVVQSGATQSMFTLVKNWHEKGVEVLAFAPQEDSLFVELRNIGIECRLLPMGNSRYNRSRNIIRRTVVRLYSLYTLHKLENYTKKYLIQLLKDENVDIVYANSSACVIGYYIKKYSNFPLVWHIREFGKLDQNVGFIGGDRKLYQMISTSDLVIYISNTIEHYYKANVQSKKSVVIYNDLTSDYDSFSERDWSKRPVPILSCGALNPGKGHLDVIRAVSILVNNNIDVELYIAGKGDIYLPLYTKLIRELSLQNRVHMLGQVSDMKSLREKCNIGVVASRMEAFGRVTVEGMLSGLAMVGANTGGTSELISDKKTGFLYNVGNIEELSEKISFLIKHPEVAKTIAKDGYSFAQQFIKGNCADLIFSELKKL